MKITKKLTAFALAAVVMSTACVSTLNAGAQSGENTTLEAVYDKLDSTTDYLTSLSVSSAAVFGNEWYMFGLARNEKMSDELAQSYKANVEAYVSELGSSKLSETKSTENSRLIIALSSLGIDARDISGYDLTEPYADFEYIQKQGINGPVYALLALDTFGYEIPTDSTVTEQTTREKLVDYVLSKALENGGWTFWGSNADPDMTGMAIQSLAPYYNTNEAVKTAVDKALTVLSEMQNENGGFASWGTVNSESCAQAVCALTSLGIDPTSDTSFVKNGNNTVDAILSFGCENGFKHIASGKYNQMATDQAYYALTSYVRLAEDKTTLYDMSDVSPVSVKYDINDDGEVNIKDTTAIQKYLSQSASLTAIQLVRADVNGDGNVAVKDATFLQKYLASAE